jgi:hypothetical protein
VSIWAGGHHVFNRGIFVRQLIAQDMMPRVLVAPLAAFVPMGEVGLGTLALLLCLGAVPDSSSSVIAAALALLYLTFGAYSVLLLRRNPGSPCGCTSMDTSINIWVAVRAFGLGILALTALPSSNGSVRLMPPELVVALIAAAALAAVMWVLPDALGVREHLPVARANQGDRILSEGWTR